MLHDDDILHTSGTAEELLGSTAVPNTFDEASQRSGHHRRRPTMPSRVLCAQVLGLPDVHAELTDHYQQFGFLTSSTLEGFMSALRPHIRVMHRSMHHAARHAATVGTDPSALLDEMVPRAVVD